jgi:hypothetical protein
MGFVGVLPERLMPDKACGQVYVNVSAGLESRQREPVQPR